MLRRIARGGIPVLAALLGLLAAFITPPAHAATTYDITQVGKVDSFSFTDMQGRAINGTDTDGTAIADGVELADPHTKLAVRATISDLDKLDAGDRISIPVDLTGHFGFAYATWGSTVDVDGRTIATVSGSPTPTLTLTDAVKAFTTVSFTLNANTYASIVATHPEYEETESTLTVGPLKRTIANRRTTLYKDEYNGPVRGLDNLTGKVFGHMSIRLSGVFNRWLDGEIDDDMTKDIGMSYTITPLDVGIQRVDFYSQFQTCLGMATADGKHVSANSREFAGLGVTFTAPSDKAFSDPTGALKAGQATWRENTDGSWSYAVNFGPFLDNGHATYSMSASHPDSLTQAILDKARAAKTMAQLVLCRFAVFPQSTEGNYRFRFDVSYYGPYVGGQSASIVATTQSVSNSGSGTKAHTITYADTMLDATKGIRYSEGSQAVIGTNEWAHDGLAFTGWNTSPNGTGTDYKPGDSLTVTGDTTLYAQWKRVPETTMPDTGGTMNHRRLTTMLGGGACPHGPSVRTHTPPQAGLIRARRVM